MIYASCCGHQVEPGDILLRDAGTNQYRHHPYCPTRSTVNFPEPVLQPVCPDYPSCPGAVAQWPQLQLWYCAICGAEFGDASKIVWVNIVQPERR